MSYLPIALLSFFLNSVSVSIDKFLLAKNNANPLIYIFYISALSLIALVILPFTPMPTPIVLLLASLSTLLWTYGAYYMFKALQNGQTTRVIPIIGALVPIILLLKGSLDNTLSINETWAAGVLILGLVFLIYPSIRGKLSFKETGLELLSAFLFALSYILLREAYLQASFISVFGWSKLILIPAGLIILAIPSSRRIIFTPQKGPKVNYFSKIGILFLAGQLTGGISQILLTYSISLANPALVNSLQGVQYAFLFIFSLFLGHKIKAFKEKNNWRSWALKLMGILIIASGLYILALAQQPAKKADLGVTFSPKYAAELRLDPKSTYDKMLTDLNVKKIRLPIYWEEVEKEPGKYDFSQADYYITQAQKYQAEVILVVGYKQPRWPECSSPEWVNKELRIMNDESKKGYLEEKILDLVKAEVEHFKQYPNVKVWQVENEPFLKFGFCYLTVEEREELLPKEISLVKSLDPNRPVLITDSGELASWRKPMKSGDWFGTTLYRTVWNPYLGLNDYPLPPFFYSSKRDLAQKLVGHKVQQTIISELQAEPWPNRQSSLADEDPKLMQRIFGPDDLITHVDYAKESDFSQIYLWGVEWWYMMQQKGYPEYIQKAKTIFK